jgi:TolB protein
MNSRKDALVYRTKMACATFVSLCAGGLTSACTTTQSPRMVVMVSPAAAPRPLNCRTKPAWSDCVAVVALDGKDTDAAAAVASDLTRSGRFVALQSSAFPRAARSGLAADSAWRGLGVDYLVLASPTGNGSLWHLGVRDLHQNGKMFAYDVARPLVASSRELARQAANRVFETITGVPGAADARIAYVAVVGTGHKREYQLVVASGDAGGRHVIATGDRPIMTPSWSPDGQRIAYVKYWLGGSGIFVQDVARGSVTRITAEYGVNGAPAWSPDGTKLAVTLSVGENTNIFVEDLVRHTRRRLTDSLAIDTEATWSPDGKTLAFMSDRGGSPRIYTVSAAGGPAHLLNMPPLHCEEPRYSPDGKSLAMIARSNGGFRVGVLRLDDGNFKFLTQGPDDETPSFTPNGALLLYTAADGQLRQLKEVSVDGGIRHNLAAGDDVREPNWSPYIN